MTTGKLVDEGGFFEYDEYRENRYGTLKSDVIRRLDSGNNVVLDLTVPGAVNLKREFGDRAKAVFIFPPSMKVLKSRLVARASDSEETIRKRMKFALESEIDKYGEFDYVIYNDVLEDSKNAILAIYDSLAKADKKSVKTAEKFKTENAKKFAENLVKSLRKEADEI